MNASTLPSHLTHLSGHVLDLGGAIALADGALAEALAGRSLHPDAALVRLYVEGSDGAQEAVLSLCGALYDTAVDAAEVSEGAQDYPETWDNVCDENADQVGDALVEADPVYEALGDEGRALIETHAWRVVRALCCAGEAEREAEMDRLNGEDEDAPDAVDLAIGISADGGVRLTGEGVVQYNGALVAKIGVYEAQDPFSYVRADTVLLDVRPGQHWMRAEELHRRVAEARAA